MANRTTRGSARLAAAAQPRTKSTEPVQLSSPPETPTPNQRSKKRSVLQTGTIHGANSGNDVPETPKSTRKRSRTATVKDEIKESIHELPHNLGTIPVLTPGRKRAKKDPATPKIDRTPKSTKVAATPNTSPKKKAPTNTYGWPDKTPFPKHLRPSNDECYNIYRLLTKRHKEHEMPGKVPEPSRDYAGCGEVPAVLDALIRTLLSAATNGGNAKRAFNGLFDEFGELKEGIGKGSIDYNNVRLADTEEIYKAIKTGGLGDNKSHYIKGILEMVWEENQERAARIAASMKVPGSKNESVEEKKAELEKAEQNVLSLEHLRELSTPDVAKELMKYPGIGPKTAACVLLFNMQRPVFAVDTHVFRLSRWLGWVPPDGDPACVTPGSRSKSTPVNRESAFAHLDFMIPDELKYPLHQLLIIHGKECPRCKGNRREGSKDWEKGCPIEEFVDRTIGRKDRKSSPVKARSNGPKIPNKKRKRVEDESEEEEAELSDVLSEEDLDELIESEEGFDELSDEKSEAK